MQEYFTQIVWPLEFLVWVMLSPWSKKPRRIWTKRNRMAEKMLKAEFDFKFLKSNEADEENGIYGLDCKNAARNE